MPLGLARHGTKRLAFQCECSVRQRTDAERALRARLQARTTVAPYPLRSLMRRHYWLFAGRCLFDDLTGGKKILRSIDEPDEYAIRATDGVIGHVKDF